MFVFMEYAVKIHEVWRREFWGQGVLGTVYSITSAIGH